MTHPPQYITNVTGGGAFPDLTGAPTTTCPGDGTTDVTSCLQTALDNAAAAGKPLLIPATASYYLISSRLVARTSVIGINGRPTIRTVSTATNAYGTVLVADNNFNGWIYNLHLVGVYDGVSTSPGTEGTPALDLSCVNGLTIWGNLFELVRGDGVSLGGYLTANCPNGVAQNVLIANNTTKDTYRCAVTPSSQAKDWVIRDNVFDKQVNYVSAVDFEPYRQGDQVNNVEVLYNKFVMNNRALLSSPSSGIASGKAVFGWQAVTNPGGNYYIHHNYGTFGTGFGSFDGSGWGYVSSSANAEGPSPLP
jgi:hypothetical protein